MGLAQRHRSKSRGPSFLPSLAAQEGSWYDVMHFMDSADGLKLRLRDALRGQASPVKDGSASQILRYPVEDSPHQQACDQHPITHPPQLEPI